MLNVRGLRDRSDLLQATRLFFINRGYIEVDTPMRLPVLLPESNLVPFTSEGWFLQASPEQCMKRLLAGGCAQLFQICHCFRKEERGRKHHPEFSMLEWYHAGWNYRDLMDECEALLSSLHATIPQSFLGEDYPLLCWQGFRIDLTPPWERLTVQDAFFRYANCDANAAVADGSFDEILVSQIEPNLGCEHPVFLCDYPAALGSLARLNPEMPQVAERFELYMAGIELANGFSELVDPQEQRQRFTQEINKVQKQGRQAAMPEKFLDALASVEETAGIALGLDRLFMLLLGKTVIDEILPFIYEEL